MWAVQVFIFLHFFLEISFGQERKNLIDWKRLNPEDWLSYERWKVQRYVREHDKDWKRKIIEKRNREVIGFVIDCINICEKIHRKIGTRNTIWEGDTITTGKASYLWMFLMDGTLVRLSPETSLTFKEINLSSKETFFYGRHNWGHIFWLSRSPFFYKETDLEETDAGFLPLNYFEANTFALKNDHLSLPIKKYKKLNKLIKENNIFIKKKTHYAFLVLSNGTVFLKNGNIEVLRQHLSKSYIKLHSDDILLQEGERETKGLFFYRGLANANELSLKENTWYEIPRDGRSLATLSKNRNFQIGEAFLKRITSILIARELFLKRYSQFFFTAHGYLRWTSMDEDKSELRLRVDFLKNDTRINETLLISKSKKLFKDFKGRSPHLEHLRYYYKTAPSDKLTHRDKESKKGINSTKKIFWQVISNKRE